METQTKNESITGGSKILKYIPETESEIYYFNKFHQAIIEINQLKEQLKLCRVDIFDLQSSLEGKKVLLKRSDKEIKKLEAEVKLYKDMSIDGKVKLTARKEIMELKNKLIQRDQMITQLLNQLSSAQAVIDSFLVNGN